MDRDGLADFLEPSARRTSAWTLGDGDGPAGLRREEVAALAHTSTDFYTRLEQRWASRPFRETVAAIARALRLTNDERDHLYELAGHAAPLRVSRSDHASPA